MKKAVSGVVLLLFFGAAAPAFSTDKFQSSFSQDYSIKNNKQELKQDLPSAPSVPAVAPSSIQPAAQETSVVVPESAPTPPIESTASVPPVSPIQQKIQAPEQKGLIDIPKTRISVPDYEKQYREMFLSQAEKAARKRKKLIESIIDEVTKYGIYLIFGFVILLILYALRKGEPAGGPTGDKPHFEDDKKDIWKEDF